MKIISYSKRIFVLLLFFNTSMTFGQLLLSESFESATIPAGWSTVDLDGDLTDDWQVLDINSSNNTVVSAFDGTYFAGSFSWVNGSPTTPDNWLISPQLSITDAGTDLDFEGISSWGTPNSGTGDYLEVMISTNTTSTSDFITVYSQNFTTESWEHVNISLASYVGQNIYIAFRHFNCSDQWFLGIDDIKVASSFSDVSIVSLPNLNEYSVYPSNQGGLDLVINPTIENSGTNLISNYTVTGNVYLSSDLVNPLQTYVFNGSNLASGSSLAVNLGTYLTSVEGEYQVIVTVSTVGDAVSTNNSITTGIYELSSNLYGRDGFNTNGGPIGVNLGTELIVGNRFDIVNQVKLDSVLFYISPQTVGGSFELLVSEMSGGLPTGVQIGTSGLFTVSQNIVDAVTTDGYFGARVEMTDMSSNPLVLMPGSYLVAIRQLNDGDNLGIVCADANITSNTSFYNIDGGAYDDLYNAVSARVPILRPFVNAYTNLQPTVIDDVASTDMNTSVNIDVLLNDSDVDGTIDPSSVTITSSPSNGVVNVNPTTGVVTYTPNNGYLGTDFFIYTVCDNGSPIMCADAFVSLTVNSTAGSIVLDFSNPADWTINGEWTITTANLPATLDSGAPFGSTTASNGYAIIDSDALGSGNTQDAIIYTTNPIDFSGFATVKMTFQQFHRRYQETTSVIVSTDAGASWTEFFVNENQTVNTSTTNPDEQIVNISTAAAGFSSVLIGFRYVGAWDYGWAVDDVILEEIIGNDVSIGTVYSHDIINVYDYSIIANSQIQPLTVGAYVTNLAANDVFGRNMNIIINDGASNVYNQNLPFDLAVGLTEFKTFSTGFVPLPDKVYTITMQLESDDNLTNNLATQVSFSTQNNIYAHDRTASGIYRWNLDDETSMGTTYEIVNATDIAGASIKFETGTTATSARLILSRFNLADAVFNNVQSMELINDFTFNIPMADIGSGNFSTINFPSEIATELGWVYVIEIRKNAGTDRIFIGGSADGDDDNSTVCYGPFGSASAVNYFTGFGFSPAVRLLLQDPVVTITSNDIDNNACTGQTITLTSSEATGNVWSNGATTSSIVVSTSGSYSVTANGITSNVIDVVIDAPVISTSFSAVSCNSVCDGSAVVNISDLGFGSTVILWNNGSNFASQTNLCAGSYNVSVTDMLGCSASQSVTITEPAAIVANTSSTNSSCGNADGAATVVASGGTGGFTYLWSNGATTSSISNVLAGSYSVTVTDITGCSEMVTASVSDAGAPTLTASSTNASCNGSTDGTVSSTATGGTGSLTYTWSNGITTPNQTGLGAGTYSIVVEDANGCTATQSVIITEPAAIVANTSSTNSSCGNADGTATVVATGGTGGFTYLWSTGATTSSISNVLAGSYSVTVTDITGCSEMVTASVSDAGAPTLTASSTNASCNGSTDGTVSSTATGGTGSLTYTWSNGITTPNQTGLGAGTYSIVVEDANGCTATQSFTITEPSAIVANTSTTNSSCGNADGTATVVATGGTGGFTYLWSTGATTSTISNLLAGSYTVTVTDITGCSEMVTASVSDAGAPTLTASSTNASCNGSTDGTVSSTATGGTGSLTYTWSNGITTPNQTGLGAGTYSIVVEDANGCTATQSVTITQPAAITINTSSTNASCNGSLDGTVSSTAIGGTGTLTYTWSNGITTANQSGLGAGTYSIVVEDANGCTAVQPVTITQPAAIVANASSTNSTCGNADGSATVLASGGTGGFSYVWSNGAATATASNLLAGSYSVTITDNSGCSSMATASVSDAGAPSLTASSTNASCNGSLDGTVSSTATGGTGILTYTWSNGIAAPNQTGLGAGTYSIVVEDANGCTATQSVTITQPAAIIVNTSTTNSSCGSSNGSATVVASGGTGGFSYDWSTGATTVTASNLMAGSYTVTATDNSGCSSMATASVSDVGAPSLTASSTNASCNGSLDGTVSSTATGGTGTLTYTWSNGIAAPNQTGLGAGTYSIVVEDANGCTATQSVTITQPAAIIVNTSTTNSSCGSSNGSATVVASGGTGGFSYDWSTGATTATASNLMAGSYTVTATDNSGCSSMVTASVSDAGAPSLTASSTNASCNGSLDGTVSSTATGGTGTLTYTWSNGITTANQTGLGAGTYSIIVEDANGCTATQSVTITQPAAIIVNTSTTNSSCGSSNGSATVVASGGTGGFSYDWSTGATTATASNLMAGSYTVTATDNSGCSSMATASVSDAGAPSLTASSTNASCNGSLDGTVSSTATGGTGTLTYTWSNGITTANQTGLGAGTYSVVVEDANGCAATQSVTISEPGAIVANTSSTNSSCGNADGSGLVVAVGGTGGFTYSWSNGSTGSSVTNLMAGNYTIVVTDNSGCSIDAIVSVFDNGAPSVPTITSNDPNNSICSGETVTLTSSSTTMNVWSTGATTTTIDVTSSGTYTLKLVDVNGCQSPIVSVTIIVNQIPNVNAGLDLSICQGDAVTLSGTGAQTYSWDNSVTNGQLFIPINGGIYTVIGTDINGCQNTDNLLITLNNCASINETQTELVSVYPNPSTGKFVVNLNDLTDVKNYTVLDQLGKRLVVETINSIEFSIDLSSYSNGIYYLLFNENELNQQRYKIEVVK